MQWFVCLGAGTTSIACISADCTLYEGPGTGPHGAISRPWVAERVAVGGASRPSRDSNPTLRAGLAPCYGRYAEGYEHLYRLQDQARRAKVGLWSGADPTPPWDWRQLRRKGVNLTMGFEASQGMLHCARRWSVAHRPCDRTFSTHT